MSRFIVDSASLDRIGERLAVLHGQLLSVPVIVGSYTATMLGGTELETELDGLRREWNHQVTGVAADIDLMQLRVATAALAYRHIEAHQRERARHAKRPSRPPNGGVGIGSGTTVIDPGDGGHHRHSGTGSGTTVSGGGGSGTGSGATVIGGH